MQLVNIKQGVTIVLLLIDAVAFNTQDLQNNQFDKETWN